MKKYPLIILLVVILAAVGSYYAIPNRQEIALINFKDKKFDEAQAMYEEQLKKGKLTPETAGNLVDLYLQNGRVDDAIKVMQQFVQKRPNDLSARVILGQLYQYAQRQDDYLKNLEEIKAMNPSEDVLAKLHEAYQKDAQFEKQLTALEALVKQGSGNDPSRYRSLANMQAQAKHWEEAIASLKKLRETDPAHFKFPEVELLVSIETEAKHSQDALAEAQGWASQKEATPQELARLANILHYKDSPQTALTFLSGIQARIPESPELMTEYVLALIGAGESDKAYAQMKALHEANQLPAPLARELLFMAIAANDMELAGQLYDKVDVAQFNESQLITLLELSQIRKQPELLAKLHDKFGSPESLARFPLFSAVLALADKAPDVNERLAKLKELPLTHAQRLVVARACARAGNMKCVRSVMDQLGDLSSLSDTEIKDVAELYLLSGEIDTGYEFVTKMRTTHPSPQIDVAWAKFAAAKGQTEALSTWLDGNAKLSPDEFKSLYFLANDRHHVGTALMVAERLYAREQSAENRNFLTSAYIANKQYEKALPLFKSIAKRSPQDEDNYFFLLVNLAKKNPKYKAELTDYAAAHLKSAGSERKRLAMVYTLIEAGRADVALPFIKEYATKFGGQWVEIYASNLDKKGLTQESRNFRMEIATKPYTAAPVKRQIAYTLLNQGFKDDAASLFYGLAEQGGTKEDAEQLLYLWGPRLSQQQAEWVAGKALSSQGAMYDFWVVRLVTQTSAEDMVAFVSAHPDSVNDQRVAAKYVQSLATLGYLDDAKSAQAASILRSKNPKLLREFARTARANSKPRPAREAYETLAHLSPDDQEALRNAGLIAFSQADYKKSDSYISSYLAGNKQPDGETYLALFYKAEMLRKQGKAADAKRYYQRCLDTIVGSSERSLDMQSKALQSMILTGNVENGIAGYRELLNKNPQNATIRADFAAALIEVKRYDEARSLLDVPVEQLNPSAGTATLSLPRSELGGYRFFSGGNELLLQVQSPELRHQLANPATAKQFDWMGYATEGQDRVLIVAQPGVQLALAPTAQGYDIFPQAANQLAAKDAQRQMKLRYALLKARIDVETGQSARAVNQLAQLRPYYPQDAQLLGFSANAENYAGRWRRALALLDEAAKIAPENQDVSKLRRDIWLAHAPNIKLDEEWIRIGDSDQYRSTLSGRADIDKATDVSLMVQDNYLRGKNIQASARRNGAIGDYNRNVQRGEVTVTHDFSDSLTGRAALYANNNFVGAGLGASFLNPLGETDLFLEYHRPTFDFVEGILVDLARDRVGFTHTIKPSTRWLINFGAAYNRYAAQIFHDKDENDLFESVTFGGQVYYQLTEASQSNPNFSLFYGLDAEYRTDAIFRSSAINPYYTDVPMDTREVHTLGLVTDYTFDTNTNGSLFTGYSVDRHGGNGPVVEGRLTHEMLADRLEGQIRAGYGARTSNKEGDTAHVGGYLMWRF